MSEPQTTATTKVVRVTFDVEVTVDAAAFDEKFMSEFRADFYDFHTLDDHLRHLARNYARANISGFDDFIEGYGHPDEIGFHAQINDEDQEVLR